MSLLLKSLKRLDSRPSEAAAPESTAPPEGLPQAPAELQLPSLELPDDLPWEGALDEVAPELWLPEAVSPEDVPSPALPETELSLEAIPFEELEQPAESCESEPELIPDELEMFEPLEQESQASLEPPASIEPLPTHAEEPVSKETTLDRLNELHALIDAALCEFQSAAPIDAQPPDADSVVSTLAESETTTDIDQSPLDVSSDVVVPSATPLPAPIELPAFFPLASTVAAAPARDISAPSLRIRDEYRELRDHLLSRFSLETPCTLLLVDAGRAVGDASWLVPFAACLGQHLCDMQDSKENSGPPKILLVEAAGPECCVAESLGIDCPQGLADVLHCDVKWPAAIQRTAHPQIEVLARGSVSMPADFNQQLAKLWDDLERNYDMVLVAAGPWQPARRMNSAAGRTISALLPLSSAAMLCVELDGTPQSLALETKRELEKRGVQLLGCVVSGEVSGD